jgi:hypothetical protein
MTQAPQRAQALALEAERLYHAGRLVEAEALFREAVALEPTPGRLHNIGTIRQLVGRHAEAEALFRQALALDPGFHRARATLGMSLLAQGRLAEGFAEYDAWRRVPGYQDKAAPDIGVPLWQGEPLDGKRVVIWAEEGFGDQLMYARFVRQLVDGGATVGWAAHPAMVRLIREGLGMEAAGLDNTVQIAAPDVLIPSSRLPLHLMREAGPPPATPYLRPPAPRRIAGLTIGVVAQGNPEHDNDRYRSMTPAAAAALLDLPGAVSLTPKDTGARDFYDTASIIAGLDLVITVDTSVAHLAGALGKPVWVLLPMYGCDWRWGQGRADSDWYPTARLFRQRSPGDWAGVLREVRAAL